MGAVVVRGGKALIVKRAFEPRLGEWSLPGGVLELGESLQDAAGKIRYHFVIVDFVCWPGGGEASPGSDAESVAWVSAAEIDDYRVNAHAKDVILRGLNYHRQP